MLFLLLACEQPKTPTSPRVSDAESELFPTIYASLSEKVPTLIVVEAQTRMGLATQVRYAIDNGEELLTPISTGINHRFVLGGIPENSEVTAIIETPEGNSGEISITTGQLSYQPLSSMTIESELNGFILTTVRGDTPGIAIWNGAGELVWSLPQPEGRRETLQTHYLDGQIFRNFMDLQLHQEIGQIEVMDIEAKVEGTIELPLHHHAFTPIGPSQVAALAIDVQETDEFGPVVGDKVMVADVGGSQFPLFSVWDHFQVAETPRFNQPFYSQGKDWTHASGIATKTGGGFTLTLMGLGAIVDIDSNGLVQRVFSDSGLPECTHPIDSPKLVRPHGANWAGEELLVFHSPNLESRGARLDVQHSSAEWNSEILNPGIHALALGDIQDISTETEHATMINFGSAGQLAFYSDQGTQIWLMETYLGSFFSSAHWMPSFSTAR